VDEAFNEWSERNATAWMAWLRWRRLHEAGAVLDLMPLDEALPTQTVRDLPACCIDSEGAELGGRLYCASNRGGSRPGLNYQNLPCPTWDALPVDVRAKWRAVADFVRDEAGEE
jgi:hypothetical protein